MKIFSNTDQRNHHRLKWNHHRSENSQKNRVAKFSWIPHKLIRRCRADQKNA
ncbi:hypothetical protein D3C73_476180 [compost metagenome]